MKNSFSESYKAAGVDVTAGYEGVKLMKKDVERTFIPGVLTGIGGFGGLFQMIVHRHFHGILPNFYFQCILAIYHIRFQIRRVFRFQCILVTLHFIFYDFRNI